MIVNKLSNKFALMRVNLHFWDVNLYFWECLHFWRNLNFFLEFFYFSKVQINEFQKCKFFSKVQIYMSKMQIFLGHRKNFLFGERTPYFTNFSHGTQFLWASKYSKRTSNCAVTCKFVGWQKKLALLRKN